MAARATEPVVYREMTEKALADTVQTRRGKGKLLCACGALVAVLTSEGVEIKCRRCKRIVFIPLTDLRKDEIEFVL